MCSTFKVSLAVNNYKEVILSKFDNVLASKSTQAFYQKISSDLSVQEAVASRFLKLRSFFDSESLAQNPVINDEFAGVDSQNIKNFLAQINSILAFSIEHSDAKDKLEKESGREIVIGVNTLLQRLLKCFLINPSFLVIKTIITECPLEGAYVLSKAADKPIYSSKTCKVGAVAEIKKKNFKVGVNKGVLNFLFSIQLQFFFKSEKKPKTTKVKGVTKIGIGEVA